MGKINKFRLWVFLSLLWALVLGGIFFGDVRSEIQAKTSANYIRGLRDRIFEPDSEWSVCRKKYNEGNPVADAAVNDCEINDFPQCDVDSTGVSKDAYIFVIEACSFVERSKCISAAVPQCANVLREEVQKYPKEVTVGDHIKSAFEAAKESSTTRLALLLIFGGPAAFLIILISWRRVGAWLTG